MGGRGNSSPGGGGGGAQQQAAQQAVQQQVAQGVDVDALADDYRAGITKYTANGSAEMVNFQSMVTNGKGVGATAQTIRDLASGDLNKDPQYADGYEYYDIPLNAALAKLGAGGKATVLSDSDFDDYLSQTGQESFYRGMSGTDSFNRLQNQTYNHVGSGAYGDGYYYSPSKSVANTYARSAGATAGTKSIARVALSPNARVITHSQLQKEMAKMSPTVRKALASTTHTTNKSGYSGNTGEALAALMLGYNVVQVTSGHHGYYYAVSADALVVSQSGIAVK